MIQSQALLRRIFGKETEVALPADIHGCPTVSPKLSNKFWDEGRSGETSTALRDGGRLYLDGNHWEIASSEEDSLKRIVLRIRANDLHFSNLFSHHMTGEDQELFPNKKNVDDLSNESFGSHDNYLIKRQFLSETSKLLPIFILKNILVGAGGLRTDSKDFREDFLISPKALHIHNTKADPSTINRVILNSRDEPWTDPRKYARLHVVSGDANANQWATFLSYGIMHIALCLLEDGEFEPSKTAGKLFAYDESMAVFDFHSVASCIGKWRIEGMQRPDMRNGIHALRTFFEIARARYRQPEISSEMSECIDLSLMLLKHLRHFKGSFDKQGHSNDNFSVVAKYMDWPRKLSLFETFAQDLAKNPRSELDIDLLTDLRSQDLAYHHMNPQFSLLHYLEFGAGSNSPFAVKPMHSFESIESAINIPCRKTRAAFRGCITKLAEENELEETTINWDELSIPALNFHATIDNPLSNYKKLHENLMNLL